MREILKSLVLVKINYISYRNIYICTIIEKVIAVMQRGSNLRKRLVDHPVAMGKTHVLEISIWQELNQTSDKCLAPMLGL